MEPEETANKIIEAFVNYHKEENYMNIIWTKIDKYTKIQSKELGIDPEEDRDTFS